MLSTLQAKNLSALVFSSLLLPLTASATTPDEVLATFTALMKAQNYQFKTKQIASKTLVKGIYVIWDKTDDISSSVLTNENASIFSDDSGITWKYSAPGHRAVENLDNLRNALRANIRFDELIDKKIGVGQRKVVYFGGFDCPWCKVFQGQLKNTKSLSTTIYLVPNALDSTIPTSRSIVRSLWCDPRGWDNWEQFMQTRQTNLLVQPSSTCSPLKSSAQAYFLMRMTATRASFPRLIDDGGWDGNLTLKPAPSAAEWAKIMGTNNKPTAESIFAQQVDLANWGKAPSASTKSGSGSYQIGEGAGQETKSNSDSDSDSETLNLGGIKIKLPSLK